MVLSGGVGISVPGGLPGHTCNTGRVETPYSGAGGVCARLKVATSEQSINTLVRIAKHVVIVSNSFRYRSGSLSLKRCATFRSREVDRMIREHVHYRVQPWLTPIGETPADIAPGNFNELKPYFMSLRL